MLWLSAGKLEAAGGWQAPPWTWWMDADERRRLRALPGIDHLPQLRIPRGRGALFGYVLPLVAGTPGLRSRFFTVTLARFRP